MKSIALIAGKGVSALSRMAGRGSGLTLPGVVADRLHPRLIPDLSRQLADGTVVVTGTNGKTTTAKMLGDVLVGCGRRVVRNDSGSNLRQGIVSTFVRSASLLTGRLDGDTAVLEVDEATMPRVCAQIAPRLVCVTNLFRDQLDRYGELDATASLVREAIAAVPEASVLLNADDPLVASLAPLLGRDVRFFGVQGAEQHASATRGGHDGASGPSQGTLRPEVDFIACDVELRAQSSAFTLLAGGVATRIELPVLGLYNVYNALAASACALSVGVTPAQIAASLAEFKPAFGRTEALVVGDRRVVLVLAKNPAGAQQALCAVLASAGTRAFGIALNDNIADGTDVSWIWDVDFESFDLSGCTFVLTGGRAEDMAVRLKYAGVAERDLRVCRDPVQAVRMLAALAPSSVGAHMFATYTAMLEIRNAFAGASDPFAGLGRGLRSHA